jgi:hypothetical protein
MSGLSGSIAAMPSPVPDDTVRCPPMPAMCPASPAMRAEPVVMVKSAWKTSWLAATERLSLQSDILRPARAVQVGTANASESAMAGQDGMPPPVAEWKRADANRAKEAASEPRRTRAHLLDIGILSTATDSPA